MSVPLTLGQKFWLILKPTGIQILAAVFVALCLLVAAHSESILSRANISQEALDATHNQVMSRAEVVLKSSIASNIALITFWATIGLLVYLVCWGLYNVLIEARNQVTLEVEYTNRSHLSGAWGQLLLKLIAGSALVAFTLGFKYGFSLWLVLSESILAVTSPLTILQALLAVAGLSFQLYLLLVLVQLTITKWYAIDTFTD
jgi:hypothetical protein